MPGAELGICEKIAAMTDEGPPTSVVPVSMAAKEEDPEGKVTELPLTVRPD